MHRCVNYCFVGAGRRLRVFAGRGKRRGAKRLKAYPKWTDFAHLKAFFEGGFSPPNSPLNQHAPFHASRPIKNPPTLTPGIQ